MSGGARVSWAASMRTAFVAAMARPEWWVMALAAFLVRGGLLVVLLPLVSLPSVAAVATAFGPSIEGVVLGRPSLEGALLGTIVITGFVGVLAAAGLAGSWLDVALLREAAVDDDVDLRWQPSIPSARRAFGVRLAAHVPTFVALGYASVRLVLVTYAELLSPGDPTLPVAARVIARAPDAILLVVVAWLVGEAVGGFAARTEVTGEPIRVALGRAARQLLDRRGLATLALTNTIVLAVLLGLNSAVSRAAEHLRGYLLDGTSAISLAAALLLLVSTWLLGLALLAAALAWRASAWTLESRH